MRKIEGLRCAKPLVDPLGLQPYSWWVAIHCRWPFCQLFCVVTVVNRQPSPMTTARTSSMIISHALADNPFAFSGSLAGWASSFGVNPRGAPDPSATPLNTLEFLMAFLS